MYKMFKPYIRSSCQSCPNYVSSPWIRNKKSAYVSAGCQSTHESNAIMYLNYRDGDRFHISPTVTHFAPSAGLGRTWRRGKVQGIPRISRGQEEGPLVEGVSIALHLTVTTLIGILTILSWPYFVFCFLRSRILLQCYFILWLEKNWCTWRKGDAIG